MSYDSYNMQFNIIQIYTLPNNSSHSPQILLPFTLLPRGFKSHLLAFGLMVSSIKSKAKSAKLKGGSFRFDAFFCQFVPFWLQFDGFWLFSTSFSFWFDA
jgi:hypothetical protein